nr:lysophospholipid acyltransferase family protein [uncultured Dethiosulfovibrio sp.]
MNQDRQWNLLRKATVMFRSIPHRGAVFIGGLMGLLLWGVSKERVDRAEARCVRALGIGPTLARDIVRKSYVNHGRCVAEFIRLPIMKDKLSSMVSIHGEHHLRDAFLRGKGVILLSGHIGNWEIGAAALAMKGYPMNAIGADQRDSRVTDMITSIRGACSVKGIGKGFNLKSALSCLRSGEILCILLDQDAKSNGLVLPFLGLPASTPYGPVKIASKLGASVVPVFSIRRGGRDRFDLHFMPPLEMPSSIASERDVEKSTSMCNDVISSWIRKHPEQWMWLYPRWSSTLGDR